MNFRNKCKRDKSAKINLSPQTKKNKQSIPQSTRFSVLSRLSEKKKRERERYLGLWVLLEGEGKATQTYVLQTGLKSLISTCNIKINEPSPT